MALKDNKKRKTGESEGLKKLREALKTGDLARAYLFYGEESYLRQEYLRLLQKTLVPQGFEEFNVHTLDGGSVTMQALADALDALPMMAERTLTVVTDLDPFKRNAEDREKLIELLEDLPEHGCLVFYCDTVSYAPDRTMKKLYAAMKDHVEVVEFLPSESRALVSWIRRHFAEQGKEIDNATADYLIFTCGDLMAGLNQEINKIAAYAKGKMVTPADIDAVAIPVLSAEAFRLSDAVIRGQSGEAARILGDLLKMQTEPIMILGALGWQLRRIYTARMAIEGRKGRGWLMDLWSAKEFQARMWMDAAQRTTLDWCSAALKEYQRLDSRMKSQRGADAEGELKLLLARLEAAR